ncbi:MAG: YraN family protein, partial [Chloroflexi bacterium]|nr:YraN family protein [Chloroflexota bacterium]
QRLGAWGEALAERALVARGYSILARNWRCARGEIDLVAKDGACYAFVEVKTRRGHTVQQPEEAFTPAKARRLAELGEAYLAEQGLEDVAWRIDLVAIELDAYGGVARLEVITGVGVAE